MDLETLTKMTTRKEAHKSRRDAYIASRVLLVLLILVLLSSFFVVINAGQRGVLMQLGNVQDQVLDVQCPMSRRIEEIPMNI